MNDQVRKLVVKAEKSLRTAKMLLHEKDLEFVASRVYYAMFYIAEALLIEQGFNFGKHSAVHSAFGLEFVKKGIFDQKYHRWLLDSFDKRIISDYEVDCEISEKEAEELIVKADDFIQTGKAHLNLD